MIDDIYYITMQIVCYILLSSSLIIIFLSIKLMTNQNQNSIGAQILYDTTSFAQDFLFLLRAACK